MGTRTDIITMADKTRSKAPPGPAGSRIMLRAKIHRATLTGKALDYEGSIALDRLLMEAADLLPGEQVHVLNVDTGARFVTYAIEAPARSGTVMLNGPAARRVQPRVVNVDARNVARVPGVEPDRRGRSARRDRAREQTK